MLFSEYTRNQAHYYNDILYLVILILLVCFSDAVVTQWCCEGLVCTQFLQYSGFYMSCVHPILCPPLKSSLVPWLLIFALTFWSWFHSMGVKERFSFFLSLKFWFIWCCIWYSLQDWIIVPLLKIDVWPWQTVACFLSCLLFLQTLILNTSKLKYLERVADKNVTLQQPNIKNKAQWSAMGMKASVHPLHPTISCTHLIIVYVNEDLTVILRSFGTMSHIRFYRSTTE